MAIATRTKIKKTAHWNEEQQLHQGSWVQNAILEWKNLQHSYHIILIYLKHNFWKHLNAFEYNIFQFDRSNRFLYQDIAAMALHQSHISSFFFLLWFSPQRFGGLQIKSKINLKIVIFTKPWAPLTKIQFHALIPNYPTYVSLNICGWWISLNCTRSKIPRI